MKERWEKYSDLKDIAKKTKFELEKMNVFLPSEGFSEMFEDSSNYYGISYVVVDEKETLQFELTLSKWESSKGSYAIRSVIGPILLEEHNFNGVAEYLSLLEQTFVKRKVETIFTEKKLVFLEEILVGMEEETQKMELHFNREKAIKSLMGLEWLSSLPELEFKCGSQYVLIESSNVEKTLTIRKLLTNGSYDGSDYILEKENFT